MAGEEERPATAQDAKYELDHTKRHQAIPSLHGGHDGGAAQQRDRDLQDTVEVEAVQTADNASEYPPHEGAGNRDAAQQDHDPGFAQELGRDMEQEIGRASCRERV